MHFTHEDYLKIEQWLKARAVKDTQLPLATCLTGKEFVPVVQDNHNKLASLLLIQKKIESMIIPDFINVTDACSCCSLTLDEALDRVPQNMRKPGTVITFRDCHRDWHILQFIGDSIYQWGDYTKWKGLFDNWMLHAVYKPDEEDLTTVLDGNQKFIKFRDREYNPEMFSGKGRKILRLNITPSCECFNDDLDHYENKISQKDFKQANTVYVIRYDFTIDGHIQMPKNCEIVFEGGTLKGGYMNLNCCKIAGMIGEESDYFIDVELENWAKGQVEYRDGEMKYWNGTEWKTIGV